MVKVHPHLRPIYPTGSTNPSTVVGYLLDLQREHPNTVFAPVDDVERFYSETRPKFVGPLAPSTTGIINALDNLPQRRPAR